MERPDIETMAYGYVEDMTSGSVHDLCDYSLVLEARNAKLEAVREAILKVIKMIDVRAYYHCAGREGTDDERIAALNDLNKTLAACEPEIEMPGQAPAVQIGEKP